MTEIIVMSRDKLNTFTYQMPNRYAIISITDPSQDVVNNKNINAYVMTILRLAFHDIDEDRFYNNVSYYAMNNEQADQVARFVKYWWNKIDYLIVQCEAGVSRSAGIAAAISKWATNDDNIYFHSGRYVPNMKCYRMVLNNLMEE